jgi:hypothetical protein
LHLEVVQAFADEEFYRLTGSFHCGGEVAALALKLWRFLRAIAEGDGRMQLIEMTLRAERLLDLVGEFHILAALR